MSLSLYERCRNSGGKIHYNTETFTPKKTFLMAGTAFGAVLLIGAGLIPFTTLSAYLPSWASSYVGLGVIGAGTFILGIDAIALMILSVCYFKNVSEKKSVLKENLTPQKKPLNEDYEKYKFLKDNVLYEIYGKERGEHYDLYVYRNQPELAKIKDGELYGAFADSGRADKRLPS